MVMQFDSCHNEGQLSKIVKDMESCNALIIAPIIKAYDIGFVAVPFSVLDWDSFKKKFLLTDSVQQTYLGE